MFLFPGIFSDFECLIIDPTTEFKLFIEVCDLFFSRIQSIFKSLTHTIYAYIKRLLGLAHFHPTTKDARSTELRGLSRSQDRNNWESFRK